MVVKKCGNGEIDCFWGNGWDNWARFRVETNAATKQRFLRHINGQNVPKPVMRDLIARYNNGVNRG